MLGDLLTNILSKRGISQREFAQCIQMNEATLSKLLNNSREAKYSEIANIARCLQISVNQLFEPDVSKGVVHHCIYCGRESISVVHNRFEYTPVYYNGSNWIIVLLTALEDIYDESIEANVGPYKFVERVTVLDGTVTFRRGDQAIHLTTGSAANIVNPGEYNMSTRKGTRAVMEVIGEEIVQLMLGFIKGKNTF